MIRVLIVDDSAIVRRVLVDQLSRYPDIQVVGTAGDPYEARDKIVELEPQVLTLDLEMPKMDGLSFLERLMKYHPLPVVVVSSLTPRNSTHAVQSLALGAMDVVCKPGSTRIAAETTQELAGAIRTAARARVGNGVSRPAPGSVAAPPPPQGEFRRDQPPRVLAIGASTGGVRAIEEVLAGLPGDTPGVLIVQHMPQHFTRAFAERLNRLYPMEVREAREGDVVRPGTVLIAPGGRHLVLTRDRGHTFSAQLTDSPPVQYQRPSVDVLFHSVARTAGKDAVGVLLTGMGADGAEGLRAMRDSGAHTVAEAEQSCVVFGMPKEAIELGAAREVLPLRQIAPAILRALRRPMGQDA